MPHLGMVTAKMGGLLMLIFSRYNAAEEAELDCKLLYGKDKKQSTLTA
jgi:hypothetical protein